MKTVYLTDEEADHAKSVAKARHEYNMLRNVSPKHGADNHKDGLELNIIGCMGEQAVAKYLGFEYDGGKLGNYKEKDVGGVYQVRSSPWVNAHLCLYDTDLDEDKFILVEVNRNLHICYLMGWLYAYEGKQIKYWGSRRNKKRKAYWIPQNELRDMETITQ